MDGVRGVGGEGHYFDLPGNKVGGLYSAGSAI